jgi:prefoldin beta subunit
MTTYLSDLRAENDMCQCQANVKFPSIFAMSQSQMSQALVTHYQQLQTKYSKQVEQKATLESQLVENKSVLNELTLAKDSKIYKLVGPVLTNVDFPEAKSSVEGRVEYIQGQIKSLDPVIEAIEKELEDVKLKLVAMQQKGQEQQVAA